MARIRVLVVEDSQTVRRHLVEVLGGDAGIEVVGEAKDGNEAMAQCRDLRPDVVTLDLAMPGQDGLAVTEHIMAFYPTPILIISGSHERGELFKTYDALAAGALEVLDKPRGDEAAGEWERSLLARVKLASRIKVITHLRGRLAQRRIRDVAAPQAVSAQEVSAKGVEPRVVAIGTSTGGPGALVNVLGALPQSFPLPLLVVIHLSEAHATAFAQWLADHVRLPVAMAEDDQPLSAAGGRVLIAAPERHLAVRGGRLRYERSPPLHHCRPSVDVLFNSLAAEMAHHCVAALLTGMGKDGAQGLLAVRRAGGHTIAEAESTAVVYGMPREASRLGAADHLLPIHEIGPHLLQLVRSRERRG